MLTIELLPQLSCVVKQVLSLFVILILHLSVDYRGLDGVLDVFVVDVDDGFFQEVVVLDMRDAFFHFDFEGTNPI